MWITALHLEIVARNAWDHTHLSSGSCKHVHSLARRKSSSSLLECLPYQCLIIMNITVENLSQSCTLSPHSQCCNQAGLYGVLKHKTFYKINLALGWHIERTTMNVCISKTYKSKLWILCFIKVLALKKGFFFYISLTFGQFYQKSGLIGPEKN